MIKYLSFVPDLLYFSVHQMQNFSPVYILLWIVNVQNVVAKTNTGVIMMLFASLTRIQSCTVN